MTDKTEALLRVAEIQSSMRELAEEVAALRRIIEAPEPVAKKPLVQPERGKTGIGLNWSGRFWSLAQARAYGDAIDTLIDLRRQPGSEAAEDVKYQWNIAGRGEIQKLRSLELKISEICPWFDSEESAEAAIAAVGKDRILRMMNTLHGRGYE